MKRLKKIMILFISCVVLTGCAWNPYNAGIKSLEDGEYTKAAEKFQEAIAKEKNLADSYRGLGIAQWELGDYEGSYVAFENALSEGTEKTSTIYSLMGNCAMQMDLYEQAAEHYEQALSMDDISEELKRETQYNLIAAYEYAGNVEKAKETIATYVENYPDDENALREAGFLETR